MKQASYIGWQGLSHHALKICNDASCEVTITEDHYMALSRRTKTTRRKFFLMTTCLVALVLAVLTIGCIGAAFASRGQPLLATMFSLAAVVTAWATIRIASHLLESSSLTVFLAFAFSLGAHIAARFQRWCRSDRKVSGAGWGHVNVALEDDQVRAALRWFPIAIVHFSLDRKVRFCNTAYCRIYGFDEDELLGQSPPIPEDYSGQWREIEENLRLGRTFFNVQTIRIRKDGTLFRAYISGFPLFGDNGKLTGLFGVIVDAEHVPIGSIAYEDVMALAESSNDLLLLLDIDFRIIYANPTFTVATGVEDAMFQGTVLTEYFREEDRAAVQSELQECLALGQSRIRRNIHMSDGVTGQKIPVSLQSYLLHCSDGVTPKAIACVIHDLQEETELQDRLTQSEKERETLFRNAAVGMVKINTEGIPVAANQKLQEMLHYSEDEIKEQRFADLIHPDDQMWGRSLFLSLSTGKIQRYEVEKRLIRKDGMILRTRYVASLVCDAAGKPMFLLATVMLLPDQRLRSGELRIPCVSS